VNGDGLVDLVTMNVDDSSGVARVRPGNGRGAFRCEPTKQANCVASGDDSYYEIVAPGGADWPWAYALSQQQCRCDTRGLSVPHDVTEMVSQTSSSSTRSPALPRISRSGSTSMAPTSRVSARP